MHGQTHLRCGALAFAFTGGRALWFVQDALDPALEGPDLLITGVVTSMPQWHSDGMRFGFQVEQAQRCADQQSVQLPGRLSIGWYSSNHDGEPRAPCPTCERVNAGDLRFA